MIHRGNHRPEFTEKAATLNQPHKPRKLLAGHAQTEAAHEVLTRRGVTVVGLQELGTAARRAWRQTAGWGIICATPNNKRGRRTVSNAVAFDRATWRRRHKRQLTMPMGGRPRPLHLPVAYLEHRATGIRVAFISVHLPHPAHASAATRRRMRQDVADYCRELDKARIPWVLLGDFNDHRGHRNIGPKRVAARGRVDLVVTARRRFRICYGHTIRPGVLHRISDHGLTLARYTLKAPRRTQPKWLPRP